MLPDGSACEAVYGLLCELHRGDDGLAVLPGLDEVDTGLYLRLHGLELKVAVADVLLRILDRHGFDRLLIRLTVVQGYMIHGGRNQQDVGVDVLCEEGCGAVLLDDGGCPEATVLHCNTQYPTPYEDANLTAMLELMDQFGLPVGLSDHTPGWECDVAAVVLGAQVIEKHFTLDKSLPGPDQKASLDPAEFKAMVDAVRHVEAALGDGHKHLTESEAPNKAVARKSIVAARAIRAGETFTADNLTTKRPGDGISPMRWYEVLGKIAKRDFAEDEKIEL